MIRRGDVSRVASMFYLVPVSAAAASFFIFGERFDATVVTGVCIVALGVLLVNAKPAEVCTGHRAADRVSPVGGCDVVRCGMV